jgi:hypothetical protein
VDFWTLVVALVAAGGFGGMFGNSLRRRYR